MPEGALSIGAVICGGGLQVAQPLSPHDVQIGQRIRRRRLLIGLSQVRMAAALGISEELLESYELGRTWIDLVRLFEIADLLGVSINFFNDDTSFPGDSASATRTGSPVSGIQRAPGLDHPILSGKMRRRWLE